MVQKVIPCPAYDRCHQLGTARFSCEDLRHHYAGDGSVSEETKYLREISSRLTEMQACLSSIVLSLQPQSPE